MSIDPRWRTMLALASIWAASCTKRNPDLCCENSAECTAIGFSSFETCDLGVCVQNACTTTPNVCDDDLDCPDEANHCVSGTCAACATDDTCPVSAPVCDTTAHSCRGCAKDSECDSLACDLAAGTCVEQTQVLYASPGGSVASVCSRPAPCSLAHAAELVTDKGNYIVLLPGDYSDGASFRAKNTVVTGQNACITITTGDSLISVSSSAAVLMRNLCIKEELIPNAGETSDAIYATGNLVLDNIDSQTDTIPAVTASRLTLTKSTFRGGGGLIVSQSLLADRNTFIDAGILLTGNGEITNSIFYASGGRVNLNIKPGDGISGDTRVSYSSFVQGIIRCAETTYAHVKLENNIFFNLKTIETPCNYSNNLIEPLVSALADGNLGGDPRLVAPTGMDFHLQSASAAIDKGSKLSTAPDHDFDGRPRPVGGGADLGALEYYH